MIPDLARPAGSGVAWPRAEDSGLLLNPLSQTYAAQTMDGLRIDPIREADLPEVARFIRRATPPAGGAPGLSEERIAEVLVWRLLGNPARGPRQELGHAVRRADGILAGVHLMHPFRFRLGSRHLIGLGSGSFYADRDAAMGGFLLFRRFLSVPEVDFWFANTANRSAGRLWEKLGGRPVAESDHEDLLVVRPAALARELMLRRGWGGAAASVAAAAASFGSRLRATHRFRSSLRAEATRDWDCLAEISRTHAPSDRLVVDPSADYLRWTYGDAPRWLQRSVRVFSDDAGRQGWFGLGVKNRGHGGRIRCALLLDFCVPPPPFDRLDAVRAAFAAGADDADVVSIRGRADLPALSEQISLRRRRFDGPTGYVIWPAVQTAPLESLTVLAEADAI